MNTKRLRPAALRPAALLAAFVALAMPLWSSPAAAQAAQRCDRACLVDLADRYMAALLAKDPHTLPWAERVRHSENDVPMMIGDGVWGTVTKYTEALKTADPVTGNAFWLGVIEEHGQAAYYAMRIGVVDREIAEVETAVAREGTPAHFTRPGDYRVDAAFAAAVPANARSSRGDLTAIVDGYYDAVELNEGGRVGAEVANDCRRVSNGVVTSHAEGVPAGCRAQLEAGLFKPVDSIRALRFPVVDEERGIVVAIALLDHAARYRDYTTRDGVERKIPVEYPNTHGVVEMFKIVDGAIERIEGVAVFQPYFMPTMWTEPAAAGTATASQSPAREGRFRYSQGPSPVR
jgi:hypothetical protein